MVVGEKSLTIDGISLRVRPASRRDVPQLNDWCLADYWVGRRFGQVGDAEALGAIIGNRVTYHWLAWSGDSLVAQALCYGVSTRDRYAMAAVDVVEGWRGIGIGGGLLTAFLPYIFGRAPIRKVYIHRLVQAGWSGEVRPPLVKEGLLEAAEVVGGREYDLLILAAWRSASSTGRSAMQA